jgi:hypothetical protein
MLWVIVALVVLFAWIWAERSRELFCIDFRAGKMLLVRGRIPPTLAHDFLDALKRQDISRATLRAFRRPDGAELVVSGAVDDFQAQRLRNIFRLYPISNLTAAPVMKQRTVGQILGITWLAWLLSDR